MLLRRLRKVGCGEVKVTYASHIGGFNHGGFDQRYSRTQLEFESYLSKKIRISIDIITKAFGILTREVHLV